jgi:hypothetical protein
MIVLKVILIVFIFFFFFFFFFWYEFLFCVVKVVMVADYCKVNFAMQLLGTVQSLTFRREVCNSCES